MVNRYPGTCTNCGQRVNAGQGEAYKAAGASKWATKHSGSCPTSAPSVAAPKPQSFAPTPEQVKCVELFETGKDLVIQAVAGAGKTSTLLLIAQAAAKSGRRGQYAAYNRAIVQDVGAKLQAHGITNVEAKTLHGLAWQAIVKPEPAYQRKLNADRQKPQEIASILGIQSLQLAGRDLAAGWLAVKTIQAVRKYCNSADPEISTRHFEVIDTLDAAGEYTNNNALAAHLLPYARKAWADIISKTGRLNWGRAHDYYLKLWSLDDPQMGADFVLLDEAQDADPVQLQIVLNQKKYGTQVVVVGDEQQVLYEWRGAVNALQQFESAGAELAFLTQSFRFGPAVADVANTILARNNARMTVRGFDKIETVVGPVSDPKAILCRTNAGAIRALFGEKAKGRKAHLVGGTTDVVWFCESAQALQDGRKATHPELSIFSSWTEVQQAVQDGNADDLRLLVKLIDDFGAKDIVEALKYQPDERDSDVVVSTAHKSKGLEWDSVSISADFVPPKGKDGDKPRDMTPAELRLAYVACTRAKHQLDITQVPHFLG